MAAAGLEGAGEGAAKKRKRIAPTLITAGPATGGPPEQVSGGASSSGATAASGGAAPDAGVAAPEDYMPGLPGSSGGDGCWATDAAGVWEVWAQNRAGGGTLVRGLRKGETVWEALVKPAVQHLVVEGGLAALAGGGELHVLSAETGRLVWPPVALPSKPLHLELSSEGHLLALCGDASVTVWSVADCARVAQASLRHICAPSELRMLKVKAKTGEPFAQTLDGRLLLFKAGIQSWVELSAAGAEAGRQPAPDAAAKSEGLALSLGIAERRPVDAASLEADLLAALCLGDTEAFLERLGGLARHLAPRDPGRLRGWCAALLGRSLGAAEERPWLAAELEAAGLAGRSLVHEVVLPALGAGPSTRELQAELEAALGGPRAEAAPLF